MSLSDIPLDEIWNSKRAKYERYTDVNKTGASEDQFQYRIQTAWRIHGGHCIFDSQPNKWECDDYPIESNNDGNIHTIELKPLKHSQ